MGTFSNGISYYDFNCVSKQSDNSGDLLETYLYSFKSPKTNMRYIAEVEHYKSDLYAIKFYLKVHQNSKDRFTVLTNLHEARPVIYTCIAILIDIYRQNNKASFAFIGSPSPKEIEREKRNPRQKKENRTQRFRIYSTLMSTFFSETYFEHRNSPRHSLYLMRNKSSRYSLKEIQGMINTIYNIDVNDLA